LIVITLSRHEKFIISSLLLLFAVAVGVIYFKKVVELDRVFKRDVFLGLGRIFTLFLLTNLLRFSGLLSLVKFYVYKLRRIGIFSRWGVYLLFVFLMAILLTNDISLLIIMPLLPIFSNFLNSDLLSLAVFTAVVVNLFSGFSPIGNPQNMYLMSFYSFGVIEFFKMMLPYLLFSALLALLFYFSVFRRMFKLEKNIKFNGVENEKGRISIYRLLIALLIMLIFVMAMDFGVDVYIQLPIWVLSFLLFEDVFATLDWFLIVALLLLILDFRLFSFLLEKIVDTDCFDSKFKLSSFALLLSQVISNVPATVLLAHKYVDVKALSYGVNLGGCGVLTSSLANMIVLRFVQKWGLAIDFVKYYHIFGVTMFVFSILFLKFLFG